MQKDFNYLNFIPEINYQTRPQEVLKINIFAPEEHSFCPMVWQNGDNWTTCLTFLVTPDTMKQNLDYQYIICDYHSGKIYKSDVKRSVNLSIFNPILTKDNLFCLEVRDFWSFPEKTMSKFQQISLKNDIWAIILGKNLNSDGSPKVELLARIKKLSNILKKKPSLYQKVVLTGGKVMQKIISEAEMMEKLALEEGIPKSLLIPEKEAKTTMENAIFTKIIAAKEGITKFCIISSKYHLERSEKIFKKVFQVKNLYEFGLEDDDAENILEEEYLKINRKKEDALSQNLVLHPLYSGFWDIL